MFVDCIEIVAGLRIALGRVRGKVLCGSLPVSLFYKWRAARSPIAWGLLWDWGLHWNWLDCGMISRHLQWVDGRPAWHGLFYIWRAACSPIAFELLYDQGLQRISNSCAFVCLVFGRL